MKIENEFTVAAPIQRAWEVLTDIPGIVPCMPGAQLVGMEQNEDGSDAYKGKVKVKIGPVVSEYAGVASFIEKDDDKYRAVIDAKGRDSRGAGNAAATIVISMRSEGAGDGEKTTVGIDTDLKISGKIAQFGSSMIKEVSEKLLGQFVACLEGKLHDPAELDASQAGPVHEAGTLADDPEPALAHAGAAAGSPAPATSYSASTAGRVTSTPEVEALDLLDLAGNAAAKRIVPLVVGIVAVVAAFVYFLRR